MYPPQLVLSHSRPRTDPLGWAWMKAMVAVATPSFGGWDGHSPKVTYRGRGKTALRIPPESPHTGHEKRQRVGWTRASPGRGCPGQGRGPKEACSSKANPRTGAYKWLTKDPYPKFIKDLQYSNDKKTNNRVLKNGQKKKKLDTSPKKKRAQQISAWKDAQSLVAGRQMQIKPQGDAPKHLWDGLK